MPAVYGGGSGGGYVPTPARSIGVYYKRSTRKIMRVKVPDWEEELDNPRHIQRGEALLRVPKEAFGIPTRETLAAFVRKVERWLP